VVEKLKLIGSILLLWTIISVPAGLIIGNLISRGKKYQRGGF